MVGGLLGQERETGKKRNEREGEGEEDGWRDNEEEKRSGERRAGGAVNPGIYAGGPGGSPVIPPLNPSRHAPLTKIAYPLPGSSLAENLHPVAGSYS